MKVLHLTLKKKWFDMIASGEKKEEYRDLKIYWANRLCNKIICDHLQNWLYNIEPEDVVFKEFDVVKFRNGYSKTSPTLTVKCKWIEIGEGRPFWGGDEDTKYFVIKLGDIINQSTIK